MTDNISQLFENNANTTLAVTDSSAAVTQSALRSYATQLSAKLKELTPNAIGIYLDNGIDWIISDFAGAYANVPVVPIPTFFSSQQIEHIIQNTGIDLVVTDHKGLNIPHCQDWKIHGHQFENKIFILAASARKGKQPYLNGVAKITYTSGSTGAPKGVCLSTQAMLQVATSLTLVLSNLRIKKHLCVLPLPTLLENIAGVYAPLSIGATVCVPSLAEVGFQDANMINPELFLKCLHSYKPDSIILVPELLKVLVHLAENGAAFPSLKFVAVGGGHVSPNWILRAKSLGLPVYEGYGLSECCSVVTLNLPWQEKIGSAGKPLPHAQVRINNEGEIEVAGATLEGYLGSALELSESFFKTGDLGHFDDDGYLVISGRKKNMFITSYGRKICPEWLEQKLLDIPEVSQAIVFGEDLSRTMAVIVPQKSAVVHETIDKKIDEANQQLPAYAQVHAWMYAHEPFSVKNGMLTLNGRLKREFIWKLYQKDLERLNVQYVV